MSATMAARSHSTATLSAPQLKGGRRKASWLLRLWRSLARRPGRSLILVVFSAAAAAILLNAMMFQKARHPAPILSAPSATPAAPRHAAPRVEQPAAIVTPPAAPVIAPTGPALRPPARPSDLSQAAREAQPRPPAPVTAAPRAAPAAAASTPARTAAPRDPIADLINGVDMRPPADIRGAAASKPMRRTAEN